VGIRPTGAALAGSGCSSCCGAVDRIVVAAGSILGDAGNILGDAGVPVRVVMVDQAADFIFEGCGWFVLRCHVACGVGQRGEEEQGCGEAHRRGVPGYTEDDLMCEGEQAI